MLILTRRVGETIVIGNEVFCTILEHQLRGQLKLVFDAPEYIPIHRFEIQRRIMQKIKLGAYEQGMDLGETVIDRLAKKTTKESQN